jgi:SagB-type dehydrogenase family enzyme
MRAGILFMSFSFFMCMLCSAEVFSEQNKGIQLPEPDFTGEVSVEEVLFSRRSVRAFSDIPVGLDEVSQILWAAGGITVDGITGPTRAYPSAGGIYPLVIYAVAGDVEGLAPGVYKYSPFSNSLIPVMEGDIRARLSRAAYGQKMVEEAPLCLVVSALYDRTVSRYGERGRTRYVPMDAGHLGQNVALQAHAEGLGTVMVGAFNDAEVKDAAGIDRGTPVYIIPVGKPE